LISETESILIVGMASLALYKALGIPLVQWWTQLDERVCFVGNTMVLTKGGEKPIQDVEEGDYVKTRAGWNRVISTSRRSYSGPMTSIKVAGRTVTATADHPIWKHDHGWLSIGNFKTGDLVQGVDNQPHEIVHLINFCLGNANDPPSFFKEISIFSRILGRVLMPIISIDFNGNSVGRNSKIDRVSSNLRFLDVFYSDLVKTFSNLFLNRRFSLESSIAGKAAESPAVVSGTHPKFLSAIGAFDYMRGTPALLRTIVPIEVFFGSEHLPAPFTLDIFSIGGSAFSAAYRVPIGDRRIDLKLLPAYRTYLDRLFCGAVDIKAFLRTVNTIFAGLCIKPFSTYGANLITSSPGPFVITLLRAEGVFTWSLMTLGEFLSAIVTRIFKTHSDVHSTTNFNELYHECSTSQIDVYDLTIDDAHEFYANGILVHNCPWCGELHGAVIETGEPWFKKGEVMDVNGASIEFKRTVLSPPLHSRCRCFLAPFFG